MGGLGYGGRLIEKFDFEIARLDTGSTSEDPTGNGDTIDSGYDPDFGEPIVTTDSQGKRTPARKELPAIRIPAQFETIDIEMFQQMANGSSPNTKFNLIMHFRNLKKLGLVDATTGEALVRPRDRVIAVYMHRTNKLIQTFRTPPGIFVSQAAPQLQLGQQRTLLIVTCEDRETGARG